MSSFREGLQNLVLAALNFVFRGRFGAEDIHFLRHLTEAGVHGDEQLARSVAIVAKNSLILDEGNQDAVALVVREHLKIAPGDAAFLNRAQIEKLHLDANFAILLGEIERHHSAKAADGDASSLQPATSILQQLEKVAILNQLDALTDLSDGFQIAYSQEGEAAILDRIFDYRSTGFYVDVGAYHPKRYSNTYACYRRGWRGINIEPTPGARELFELWRPRDIFQTCAISRTSGTRNFYLFEEPALNTFNGALADEYQRSGCRLKATQAVEVKPLSQVLAECQLDVPIDFMSVDVEDSEMEVLDSNDWERFRPRILLIEILGFDLHAATPNPVHERVLGLGYQTIAKTFNTVIYRDVQ
jgi:FkbM family methyltransferase